MTTREDIMELIEALDWMERRAAINWPAVDVAPKTEEVPSLESRYYLTCVTEDHDHDDLTDELRQAVFDSEVDWSHADPMARFSVAQIACAEAHANARRAVGDRSKPLSDETRLLCSQNAAQTISPYVDELLADQNCRDIIA